MVRLGIISDTHGRLPEGVHDAFSHVDYIVHAGDIGAPGVLWELEGIAPVFAVLGNNDWTDYGPGVKPQWSCVLGGCDVFISHFPQDAVRAARCGEFQLAVHGHTHEPRDCVLSGCRILNPGSACRPRGGSARSVALLELDGGVVGPARFVEL